LIRTLFLFHLSILTIYTYLLTVLYIKINSCTTFLLKMKNWKVKRKVKQVYWTSTPSAPVGAPSNTSSSCWGPIYTYLYTSSILSKSPIYVHATIHLRNNGAHHTHYTNVQSVGVEYSRRLPKNLWRGVEGLSPSWADVTSSSKKLFSTSSKSSSSSVHCASIARSNFLRQQSMVGEAPACGKNHMVFRVHLYMRLGCLASKCPAAFGRLQMAH
jgi:hypothetical protein